MHLELNIKYCVFFSNKTPLRDSCLLVLARTFALLSVTPSSAVKLCCRPNLCKDLSLVKQKKNQPNFLPRTPDMVLAQAPSRTCVRRSLLLYCLNSDLFNAGATVHACTCPCKHTLLTCMCVFIETSPWERGAEKNTAI